VLQVLSELIPGGPDPERDGTARRHGACRTTWPSSRCRPPHPHYPVERLRLDLRERQSHRRLDDQYAKSGYERDTIIC